MLPLAIALACLQPVEEAERRLEAARSGRPDGAGPAFEAWDRRLFEAEWELGRALLRAAEESDAPAAWSRVVAHYTAFLWDRDGSTAALEARLPLARAHQALGDWAACFSQLAVARRLESAEQRKDPDLVDVAARATALELRARALRGLDHDRSLAPARALLRQFPGRDATPVFLRLRIELGRCLAAAGRPAEAVAALEAVRAIGGETADDALEALADLVPARAAEFAERLFERRHFTEAARRFARLQPRAPRAWFRLGQCYVQMRRFHEALAALEPACATASPDRLEAALALDRVLVHLTQKLGEAALKPRLDAHRAWMRAAWPLEKAAPEVLRAQADALLREEKFPEAAELYGKLDDVDAARARGYCRYRLKDYEGALADFRRALAARRGAAGSAADLAARCLLHLDRPAEVLTLTDGAAPSDAALAEWRLAHRVDAFARLRRFEEARAELGRMKEAAAPSARLRALERLAAGYEAADDPALRGAYARTVLELSEKSLRPLRGARLLGAADALAAEGAAESNARALDLYAQYLATPGLMDEERRGVEYSAARAALAAGKLDRARELAGGLLLADPRHGAVRELEADVLAARAAALPRGAERARLLDQATADYGALAAELGARSPEEPYFRVVAKYAAGLAERNPERARQFFVLMDKRGFADWDADRWGVRSRMRALRDSLGR